MEYNNGSAFRRALEDRLRTRSLQTGMALTRLRKMVAFDRYLARLVFDQPGRWVLKGGLALQLRLGSASRTTKDIDILLIDSEQDIPAALRRAGAVELRDWFSFEVGNAESELDEPGGKRYPVRAILDSRPFETFHIDIGVGDPLIEPPVQLITPELLAFADIQPTVIPCYPLTQQIAEKLHAYTRLHPSGENSRVKDFVDMLLMAALAEIQADKLHQALVATFSQRGTHPLPGQLSSPPQSWESPYKKLAGESGVEYITLGTAFLALQKFLDPLLANHPVKIWNPTIWEWRAE
jgi:hypothetical protein